MNKKDYYEVLGVDKSASQADIKSAFRRLAKQYHPDVCKEKDAEAKFKEVQEAYSVLSDEDKRRQYDQFGHAAFQGGAGGSNPFGGGFSGFDFGDFDYTDIFDNIFGGMGFGSRSAAGGKKRPQKGNDSLVRMKLTFLESIFGVKKDLELDVMEECSECDGAGGHGEETCDKCHGSGTITSEQHTMLGTFLTKTTCPKCSGKGKIYSTTCKKCRGEGRVREHKKIEVTVPAGVDESSRLRIAGKGACGYYGGPNGDLYIEFITKEHEFFERLEDDIYLEVPITITEAILGTKKEIPTLYGNVKLTIPAGSEGGDKHRIKGKGVNNKTNKKVGDMYIVLKVVIPNKLDRQQKKLIEELNKTDLKTGELSKFEKFTKENN